MTEIIDGKLKYNETSKNSNGGTELIARRMVEYINPELLKGFQIIHSRVRELESDKKKILVCHDLPSDLEVQKLKDPEFRSQFEKIVFVSHHQQHLYNLMLDVPYSQSLVITNGIETKDIVIDKKLEKDDPIRLIYHTTPHRGLNILVPVFRELKKQFNIVLDVFSSFNVYGWEDRDKEYQKLFDEMEKISGITNHGFQPNETVREYLSKSHIFAYPSIYQETSCLALIEALCFGNIAVHSNLGALPETSLGHSIIYMYDENFTRHANAFYQNLYVLIDLIDKNRDNDTNFQNISRLTTHFYDFEKSCVPRWENLLNSLR